MSIYAANALGEYMEATNICPFNKMATCFPKAIIICSVQKLCSVWILDCMCSDYKSAFAIGRLPGGVRRTYLWNGMAAERSSRLCDRTTVLHARNAPLGV